MTTTTTREVYGCPKWCVRTDHDAEGVGPGFPAVHYGRDLGAVTPQSNGFTFEAIVYLGGEACFVTQTEELRRVAADMLAAAEWLEAHQ